MRIGELARRAGVSTRTLRHYEALGLVTARRAANGYRDYAGAELRAVAEIRALAGLGFTLEETRPFVECLRVQRAVLAMPTLQLYAAGELVAEDRRRSVEVEADPRAQAGRTRSLKFPGSASRTSGQGPGWPGRPCSLSSASRPGRARHRSMAMTNFPRDSPGHTRRRGARVPPGGHSDPG
jgi:DNA-binding transcriptional MerR regulator